MALIYTALVHAPCCLSCGSQFRNQVTLLIIKVQKNLQNGRKIMLGVSKIAMTFVRGCRSSDVRFPSKKYLKVWGRIHEVRDANYIANDRCELEHEYLVVCLNMQ